MTTYDATKICYKYDKETYKYAGLDKATLNKERTEKTGRPVYDFPVDDKAFFTFVEPPVVDDTRTPVIEEHETLVFNTMLGDWTTQVMWKTNNKRAEAPSDVVFSDINVRLLDYEKDKFLTEDAKAVFQSIYRLFTTEEDIKDIAKYFAIEPAKLFVRQDESLYKGNGFLHCMGQFKNEENREKVLDIFDMYCDLKEGLED